MSKKLIKNMALLVALLALCLTAAFSASAATENGYTYTVTDGKATITAVDSTVTGDVVIPDTLGGYPVTELEENLFADRTDLVGVTIPDSVTRIGYSAFYHCTGLTGITIPDGVTVIDECAFTDCTGLTSITIPNSVKHILYDAFSGCTGLTRINWNAESVSDFTNEYDEHYNAFYKAGSAVDGIEVVFGDNVKRIPAYAFFVGNSSNCPKIKTVTIGNSVTSIGEYAFKNCTGLTSITIPDSVESIGSSAFDDTAWLDAQPYGDVYAGKVYYTYKGTMVGKTSITFKDGTTEIADNALSCEENLIDVIIPNSVKRIGKEAFYGCHGLSRVAIPESVTTIGDYAFKNCGGLSRVTIPGNVKTIGRSAFEGSHLSYVYIEDGVESIGVYAFAHTGINYVIIPDSVKHLGGGAFCGCALNSVTIGNGVDIIYGGCSEYNDTFGGCPLTTIKIGKNVKTIEAGAFSGIKNFPEVYFAGSEEEWQAVSVDSSNDMLLRGNMHYNADISHTHSYKDEIISSETCTEDGRKLVVCDCGKVLSSEVVPAKGHDYCLTDGVQEPTCTEDGYIVRVCVRCDSERYEILPARGYHIPGEWIYETGSCTEGGTRYKECVDCGEIVESEDVEPTEHTVVTDPATPATCTTSGLSEGSHCSVCGEVLAEQEYIPATGHTEVFTEYVEPTCTEDGKTIGKVCSVCGEVIIPAVTIPARGHHYTEWIVTANPTCTVDGKQIKICACGLYEEQSIPAIGHTDENADGVCDNCSCVIDGTHQGEEEKPNSFFARIREFFAKLIEMIKNLFK